MKTAPDVADERLFENSFDPIETALARPRYGQRPEPPAEEIARTSRLSAIGCDR